MLAYSSGINHTLPTNGCARYTGGLSVLDFVKFQITLRMEKDGLHQVGETAQRFARCEGLHGHANSINIRLKSR